MTHYCEHEALSLRTKKEAGVRIETGNIECSDKTNTEHAIRQILGLLDRWKAEEIEKPVSNQFEIGSSFLF